MRVVFKNSNKLTIKIFELIKENENERDFTFIIHENFQHDMNAALVEFGFKKLKYGTLYSLSMYTVRVKTVEKYL